MISNDPATLSFQYLQDVIAQALNLFNQLRGADRPIIDNGVFIMNYFYSGGTYSSSKKVVIPSVTFSFGFLDFPHYPQKDSFRHFKRLMKQNPRLAIGDLIIDDWFAIDLRHHGKAQVNLSAGELVAIIIGALIFSSIIVIIIVVLLKRYRSKGGLFERGKNPFERRSAI